MSDHAEVEPRFKSTADPIPKARKRLPQMSKQRREEMQERAICRMEVRILAGNRCEYRDLFDTPCGWLPDRTQLEVDEIRGGSFRAVEYLDPHRCRLTCPVHHDEKTATKTPELVARIETETRKP